MLNVFSQIRPGERRQTYSAFLILFGIMMGHALLETARDALFLAKLPASHLPWVYLAIAVVALLVFAVQYRQGGVRSGRLGLNLWLAGSAAVTLGFWFVIGSMNQWALYALYTWSGVFSTLVVVRFWTLIGDLFTVGEAKRAFALIGAGSVLGAISGSALARILTAGFDPRHLLLASSGALLATALGPVFLLSSPSDETSHHTSRSDWGRPFQTIWERPYLRRVAGLVLISTITLTLVDFLFKQTVAAQVAPERLGAFFAGAYLVFNLLSLLTQIVLVGWLVRTLGINRVLSVLPSLIFLGTVALVAGGGLAAAYIVKALDGSLRHSLHRTATEVLYVPLTHELRSRLKGFIDVLGQRGGQAIASGLIFAAMAAGVPAHIGLGVLVLGLAVLWLRIANSLRSHYLNLFRETLGAVSLQTQLDFPKLDLASLETLIAALNSSNDSEVLAVMDLLADQNRVHLIPALILYHPSPKVVIRAMELFTSAGRSDYTPITERLLEHPAAEIRAAALRARSWIAPDPELSATLVEDPSPIVRVTALIGLTSYGAPSSESAWEQIHRIAEHGTTHERLALARAIRFSPGAAYTDVVLSLAETDDKAICEAVAAAMREIQSARFIPKLLEMLPDRDIRNAARSALVGLGSVALEAIDQSLSDPKLDRAVRRQLPRMIGHFPARRASEVLMRHLPLESDGGVRYRILRTLGRLRNEDPTLPLDHEVIQGAARQTLEGVLHLIEWKHRLRKGVAEDLERATPAQELILSLLDHKQVLAVERLFRYLGLLHTQEDLRNVYRGLRSGDRKVQASSLELLENLIKPPMRDPLLAVVDEIPDVTKLARAGEYHTSHPQSYEELLKELLDRGGVGMRCMVAYHIGELRLVGLGDSLVGARRDSSGLVERSIERALTLLEQPLGTEGP